MDEKTGLKKWWVLLLILLLISIILFAILPFIISLPIFVIFILPVIVFILIYEWIGKRLAATIFTVSICLNVLLILIPIIAGLVIVDTVDLGHDLIENPKNIILLNNESMPIMGVNINSSIINPTENNLGLKILTNEELENAKKNKDIFTIEIKKEAFDSIEIIHLEDRNITKEQAFKTIESNQPVQIKAVIFAFLLKEAIEDDPQSFLLDGIKHNNIKIYPRRYSLEIVKLFL